MVAGGAAHRRPVTQAATGRAWCEGHVQGCARNCNVDSLVTHRLDVLSRKDRSRKPTFLIPLVREDLIAQRVRPHQPERAKLKWPQSTGSLQIQLAYHARSQNDGCAHSHPCSCAPAPPARFEFFPAGLIMFGSLSTHIRTLKWHGPAPRARHVLCAATSTTSKENKRLCAAFATTSIPVLDRRTGFIKSLRCSCWMSSHWAHASYIKAAIASTRAFGVVFFFARANKEVVNASNRPVHYPLLQHHAQYMHTWTTGALWSYAFW